MANPKHVQIFRQDGETIRDWRETDQAEEMDPRGVDLSAAALTGVAPGYEHYGDFGPDDGRIEARLRPLSSENRRSSDLWIYRPSPPNEMRKELDTFVNSKRRDLGLAPVDLRW